MKYGTLSVTRNHGEALVLTTADGPVYLLVKQTARGMRFFLHAPRSVSIEREEIASPSDRALIDSIWGPSHSDTRMQS